MALTKMNFYIIALFVFVVVPVSLGFVGQALVLKGDFPLDDNSLQFIQDYTGYLDNQNLTGTLVDNNAEFKEEDVLTGDAEATEDFKDNFMANLNFFRIKVSKFQNFIKLLYNTPTFFVLSLGLSVSDFSWIINLMTLITFISMTILILREIK